jgi:hypothetical protein
MNANVDTCDLGDILPTRNTHTWICPFERSDTPITIISAPSSHPRGAKGITPPEPTQYHLLGQLCCGLEGLLVHPERSQIRSRLARWTGGDINKMAMSSRARNCSLGEMIGERVTEPLGVMNLLFP